MWYSSLWLLIFMQLVTLAQEAMRCNGHEEFCDRRYNEIVQINSHNATSYGKSSVQDQDRTILQQLHDWIRVFKLPIHFDYARTTDYYADMIEAHIRMLNEKINDIEQSIRHNKKKVFDALESSKHKVDSLLDSINAAEDRIKDLKDWYNKLPDISFEDPSSKTTRSIDYAARLSAFTIEKKALEAARVIAKGTLDAARKVAHGALDGDPRLAALKAQRFLAEKAAGMIKKDGTREIFSCHGLAKGELYGNYIDKLIQQAPASIKPVVTVFLAPFSKLESAGLSTLFGSRSDSGGLIPYPVCLLDTSAMKLKDFLKEVKRFLDQHPHEVVTILLNDFSYDPEEITRIFEEVGILSWLHRQDHLKPWPTFRELINKGTRLIVFSDNKYDQEKYPWLNYRRFYNAWDTSYNFESTDIFTNPKTPLSRFGEFVPMDEKYLEMLKAKINGAANEAERKDLSERYDRISSMIGPDGSRNMILDISHTVTPGLAATKADAATINKRSVLRPHIKRIIKAIKQMPSFISIDFYEYPRQVGAEKGDVFDVIDELNGVGKYKGKPLWSPDEK